MKSISRLVQSWRRGTPALLLVAATLAGASVPALAAPPKKAKPAAKAEAAPKTVPADPKETGPQPPDGKWLVDKEGRQYFINKLSKTGLRFLRMPSGKVRTAWGIDIDVVKEDDQFFYYKVYRATGSGPSGVPAALTPEELQKIADSYKVETPESQRLKLVPFGNGLPTTGQWRDSFEIADMNGDGHPDIVHSPARKTLTPPVIFLGDGKGGWRRWSEAKYPRLSWDYGGAAVGDFNGDGHPDVALGVHLRGLMALQSDGKGGFTDIGKGLDFHLPGGGREEGFSSRTLAVTDWNGDGRPDIVAVGEGPRLNLMNRDQARPTQNTEAYGVVVYLNQGNGTWLRKDQGTSSREIFSDTVTVGDFNGDHHKDFATGTSVQGRKSLVNLGRADGGWSTMDLADVRKGAYIRSVEAADLNRDGLDDLAVGYLAYEGEAWHSGIDVFYSQKDGTWKRRGLLSLDKRLEISALGHGDLDGDGKTDLVALTGDGDIWIFLGDGQGFFTRETATGIPAFPGACAGYHVRLADLDGDGKDEIVADFAGEASPMFDPDRCPSGGGIQAWHVAPAGGSH
ncbi:MAG: FG-GAP repeat domain-containing protein [Thermoanaerobaculia bacterium]